MKKRFIPPEQPLQDFGADVIRQLEERGEWDHVQGKGKPLDLQGDLTDGATLAAKLRKDAGFSTPWSDLGHEIENGEKAAREAILRAHNRRLVALQSLKPELRAIDAE